MLSSIERSFSKVRAEFGVGGPQSLYIVDNGFKTVTKSDCEAYSRPSKAFFLKCFNCEPIFIEVGEDQPGA